MRMTSTKQKIEKNCGCLISLFSLCKKPRKPNFQFSLFDVGSVFLKPIPNRLSVSRTSLLIHIYMHTYFRHVYHATLSDIAASQPINHQLISSRPHNYKHYYICCNQLTSLNHNTTWHALLAMYSPKVELKTQI